ncbi:MAG TPA: YdjY domain-containing protein [Urbifossiella sp.]|nr:YdjY domain-containing protein [Urbifossiella sp.]
MRLRLLAPLSLLLFVPPSPAFIEAPHTMGRICSESTNVVVVEIARIDDKKNLIIFKRVEDLKGKHPQEQIKHNIGNRGSHPREWKTVMEWAKVGKKAVFFHNGQASVTCIGPYWYQCFKEGEWWAMSHAEPYLLRTFCGDFDKLTPAVKEVLKGKEAVVPCLANTDVKNLHLRTGTVHTMRVSLKKLDYDAKRDVVEVIGKMTNGAMDGSAKPAAVAKVPSAPERPAGVLRFHRAISLNGPAATINGQRWDAADDPRWKVSGQRFENQKIALKPIADAATARMIRASVWGPAAEATLKNVPAGNYVVYLHVWEDNDPEEFEVSLNGKVVAKHKSGPAGKWSRLGPWTVAVKGGGSITIKNGSKTAANFSGVEVWKLEAPTVQLGVPAKRPIPTAIKIDRKAKTVSIPCKIAPRKLPQLNAVYPIEVIATFPTPDGQKAHETVVTITKELHPSDVHAALAQLGLKPGKPASSEGMTAEGPNLKIFLEVPGRDGKPRRIPIEQTLIDIKTKKPLATLEWRFTGSTARQPNPEKDEFVYGANVTGTFIAVFPVTADTVVQSALTLKDETSLKLEANKELLPKEGTAVQLILQAK